MALSKRLNFYPILYQVMFTWFLGICYGFVLLSSATGQNGESKLFLPGQSHSYGFETTLLLNEIENNSKSVGFSIFGNVLIDNVWEKNDEKLMVVQIQSPKLRVKSRKSPTPDGFVEHASQLEKFQNKPFILIWSKDQIQKILLPKDEPISLSNLKKGIASNIQFQSTETELTETDSSGRCTVSYKNLSPTKILKLKSNCDSVDLGSQKNRDDFLGTKLESLISTEYELDYSKSVLKSIRSREIHKMSVNLKQELGCLLEIQQTLNHLKTGECTVYENPKIDHIIEKLSKKHGVTFTQETLLTEKEEISNAEQKSPTTFVKEVDRFRDALQTKLLGTLKPAKAFIQLVDVAKNSAADDIAKALASKKNQGILPQLYNILGYAQTKPSYDAVNKKLRFDNEGEIDLVERYLWAISFANRPNSKVISELLKKYKKLVNIPGKAKETLILTMASAARKLRLIPITDNLKVASEVEETILNLLDYSKGEEKFQFFRALKNLQSQSTIPVLLGYIKNGTLREGELSWKAIRAFDRKLWTDDILKQAEKVYFQLDKKHDTTSRTIAADILLDAKSTPILEDILLYTLSNDSSAFEVKRWVLQNIQMRAENDKNFAQNLIYVMTKDDSRRYKNYDWLSPKGMSTVLKRSFFRSPMSNGSLASFQEVQNKIIKRGLINIVLEKNGITKELFSLGIFSSGLGNLVSGADKNENSQEDSNLEGDTATAGMELTILDTQIRPFVFFSGQGELMGHVWSGTASERTTALQALFMLQDHREYLRLGPGFIAELNVNGAISFDISGNIEISLWNRNSEGLVEKSAATLINGLMKVDTSFVKSQIEFTASFEPKLSLRIDSDFSSNVKLCLRLSQPDTLYRHNVFKTERISGSKHKLRISKYKKYVIPGVTYSINRKSNEVCSAIFA